MYHEKYKVDYIPHGWVLGWLKNDLRVFCSWTGGYLDGDSWRLNSEVRTVDFDDGEYIINKDGSSYQLSVMNYGRISAYNHSVLSNIRNRGFNVMCEADAFSKLEDLIDRAKELVEGIDVDLDETLDPEDDK